MNKYVIIGILIGILILGCVLEGIYFGSKNKYEILKPRTWNTVRVNYKGVEQEVLIYNNKYKLDLPIYSKDFKFKIKPKMLLLSRIKKPFQEVTDEIKEANEGLFLTNIVDSALPIVNISTEIISADTKYRILSNIPSLKATIDNEKIYLML